MAEIVVGLWSRDTVDQRHDNRSTDARVKRLEQAVKRMAARVDKENIPTGQKIRGIFVAPEYLFVRRKAVFAMEGQAGAQRSLTQHRKDLVVKQLEQVSDSYHGILIIPGTMAWKKTFTRRKSDQQYTKDKTTGQRTTVPKASRQDKAREALDKYDSLGLTIPPSTMVKVQDQDVVPLFDQICNGNAAFALRAVRAAYRSAFDTPEPYCTANDDIVFNWINSLDSNTFARLVQGLLQDAGLRQEFLQASGLRPEAIRVIPTSGDKRQMIDAGAKYLMRNTCHVCLDGKVRFKYAKREDFHEAVGADHNTVFIPGSQVGLATIEGIRFGFEICRDHGPGVLSKSVGEEKVQVHVVSSASICNIPANMPVSPGGFFLHASSDVNSTAVYENQGGTMVSLNRLRGHDKVGGDPLYYWRIQVP